MSINLQYLNWKIFLDNPAEAEPDEWFKEFNGWIPDSPEVFIDVADYKHVQDGPVVLLVGHFVNYSLDGNDRRLGLLHDYKHPVDGTNEERLRSSLLNTLKAAKRLEGAKDITHKPKFKTGDLRLIVNSRALAPNTPATLEAVKPDLVKVLAKAYGEGGFTLEHLTDPRQRFMVQVTAKSAPGLDELIKRLG
jgi:hypothetical protein